MDSISNLSGLIEISSDHKKTIKHLFIAFCDLKGNYKLVEQVPFKKNYNDKINFNVED